MPRIGIFGWGVVAPKSPNIAVFEKNLEKVITWLEPFEGFGPNNFLVGQPDFDFNDYKTWISERFEPRKYSQLKEKMGYPVKYALGAFIQALGQNPGLEQILKDLGVKTHIHIGTGLGDFPVQYQVGRQYTRAQNRWNKFWCRDLHHPELATYHQATPELKKRIAQELACPVDPALLSHDHDDIIETLEDWYTFWVKRSQGLKKYLTELKVIEAERISGDIENGKSHLMRHKIAARRKLRAKYGCPKEPWDSVDARLLWNIHNIPAAQISMLGGITGPTLAPVAACSGFGVSLKLGINAIRLNQAKAVVVGTTDPPPHPLSVGTFYGARVLSNHAEVSRPFGEMRGTHVAGGSCVWIIADADYMMAQGMTPLGLEILSVAVTSDADHIITPSSEGPLKAVEMALEEAGVTPDEIATWDAHATATPGDWNELTTTLDTLPASTKITARKGSFGHGMSVSGGWELTAQLLGAVKGKIMPVDVDPKNVHEQIQPYLGELVGSEPVELEGDITGKINMGVGGINACVICKRWKSGESRPDGRRSMT